MESKGSDDLELLERIRRGDTGGAGELFERYAPALLRFTDRMLSDRASVYDGWGHPLEEALRIEMRHGLGVLATGAEGAQRFVGGAGRGGAAT